MTETKELTPEIQVLVRMVNGLWTAYKMGAIYANWRDNSNLDRDYIIKDKCASVLPPTIVIPFREAIDIIHGL